MKPKKTKWVAVARKSLLTIAFCIIFRGAPHGDVFGQKAQICKIAKTFTKWVAVARKSLLTIAFCIIFPGAPHGDVHFGQNSEFDKLGNKNIFKKHRRLKKCLLDFLRKSRSEFKCPFSHTTPPL